MPRRPHQMIHLPLIGLLKGAKPEHPARIGQCAHDFHGIVDQTVMNRPGIRGRSTGSHGFTDGFPDIYSDGTHGHNMRLPVWLVEGQLRAEMPAVLGAFLPQVWCAGTRAWETAGRNARCTWGISALSLVCRDESAGDSGQKCPPYLGHFCPKSGVEKPGPGDRGQKCPRYGSTPSLRSRATMASRLTKFSGRMSVPGMEMP